jgi:putative spermidine/putrescine transport system ATP-binding protein
MPTMNAAPHANAGAAAACGAGAVEVVGLVKDYGSGPAAVDGVDLTIKDGSFVAILGPSGCGKSTVLGMIGGFLTPTRGEVRIGGRSVVDLPPERRPSAMVFQNLALFPHLDVAGNVAFGLRHARRMPRGERRGRVAELLDLVQLGDLARRRIAELSGGQQQRVAIARALAVEPAVLLLDEPLSALDAQMRKDMQLELRRLQQRTGTTFVYVTHDQHEAMSMADQLVVMRNGRIEQQGAPREVYDAPRNRFVARFIGDANVIDVQERRNEQAGRLLTWLGRQRPSRHGLWAVRPEAIALVDPAAAVGDCVGTVTQMTFFGQYVRYEVQIGLARPLVVAVHGDRAAFQIGDEAGVVIDTGRVTAVERS